MNMDKGLFYKASYLDNLIENLSRNRNSVITKKDLYLEDNTTFLVLFETFTNALHQTYRYTSSNERLDKFYREMIDNYIKEMGEIIKELKTEFDSL